MTSSEARASRSFARRSGRRRRTHSPSAGSAPSAANASTGSRSSAGDSLSRCSASTSTITTTTGRIEVLARPHQLPSGDYASSAPIIRITSSDAIVSADSSTNTHQQHDGQVYAPHTVTASKLMEPEWSPGRARECCHPRASVSKTSGARSVPSPSSSPSAATAGLEVMKSGTPSSGARISSTMSP
jgi:hypothetical protein